MDLDFIFQAQIFYVFQIWTLKCNSTFKKPRHNKGLRCILAPQAGTLLQLAVILDKAELERVSSIKSEHFYERAASYSDLTVTLDLLSCASLSSFCFTLISKHLFLQGCALPGQKHVLYLEGSFLSLSHSWVPISWRKHFMSIKYANSRLIKIVIVDSE
jgi:hypothetical protein